MTDPEASQEYNSDVVGVLDAQTSIGQSFVSRRPNFNGITLWLTPPPGQATASTAIFTNSISIKLYTSPGESIPLFSTTILSPTSGNNTPITINIPNQKNLSGQNYYLLLSVDSGAIQINGRNEDAYPLGQSYINGNAINADIAFRLRYDYDLNASMVDFKQFAQHPWIILPLLTLLWLPGWLCLDISRLNSHFDFGERIAIGIGLSLALIPVAMLWTTILKIKWSRNAVLFIAGFLVAIWVVRLIYAFIASNRNHSNYGYNQSSDRSTIQIKTYSRISFTPFALVMIFLATLAVRLIMVRDLATPAWVDSVHHALLTRLILNAGAYPPTFLPYLDIASTAYHLGFHSIAATFIWLTNLDLAPALLILGQVLNALSVFSVYLLATILTGSSSAGLIAAFITGFLTPMPAYYTSWGRYTELTGLLILPVVIAMIQLWCDERTKKRNIWIVLMGAFAAGGLFMVHYRVLIFLVCILLPFVIFQILFKREVSQFAPGRFLLFVVILGLLAIISVFPWFIQTIKTTLLPNIGLPVNTKVSFFQDFSWPYLTSAMGRQAMVAAALGLLWSLIKRRSLAFIIFGWVVSMFFLANLDALKLPGAGLITNLSVEIILFIPISILGAYFIDQILFHWKDLIPQRFISSSIAIIGLLFGILAYFGARQLIPIINPVTILSRDSDLPAIQWISEHIPENETIVINPFAWGYGLFAGNDGGYWISPLSGRLTLPPPVLYGLGSGIKKINQQIENVLSNSGDPTKFRDFLISQHLQYVYIGSKGGVIPPERLASSGLFKILYRQDDVWIFSVKPVR